MKRPRFLVSGLLAAMTTAAIAGIAIDRAEADTLAGPDTVLNIAHRGASGLAPEATLPAFDKAQDLNADLLELDAQLTKDGHLVAFHDTKVDRTTDGTGPLSDYTLSELKELDAGSWFNAKYSAHADPAYEGLAVPTLAEIVKRYGTREKYYIEIKSPDENPGLTEALVEFAEKHGLVEANALVVQSFDRASLKKAHELNPDIPLIQLVWYHPKNYEEGAELKEWTDVTPGPAAVTEADFARIDDYAVGIGTNRTYEDRQVIDRGFVRKAREAGLGVHVYTINEEPTMRDLVDWGVTGIFTNFPNRLNHVLAR